MASPDGFTYESAFLTSEEQAALLRVVRELKFAHDRFRGARLRRGYAQFGFAYVSTGRRLALGAPLPEFVRDLARRVRTGYGEVGALNQCIVTWYPPKAGIGWHTDAPCFGDCIIAVSLGANATIAFRPKDTSAGEDRLSLAPGSLYLLRGTSRSEYQHQILPVRDTRYSITLRTVDGVP